jgi:Ca2+-binding RTX toxin-like protein
MNVGTVAPTIGRIYVGAYTAEMTYTAVNQNKALSVGVNTYRSTAGLDVDLLNSPTGQVGLRVRQNSTTTGGPLLSVEDSTGAVKGGFDKSGYLFTQMNAAPAATDLKPGQAAFWYDPTAGASKLMVTAKDSGGTLVTGAVQLSPGTAVPPQPVPDPVDGANVISAGAGNDTISGLETSDVVFGNAGDDTLYGNGGADSLYGGAGADTLYGGAGADTLIGGAGNDTLIGGPDADRYSFGPNSGADLILGFNDAEGDVMALNGQSYVTGDDGQGNLLLTLSGGGTVTLQGVASTTTPAPSWFG